MDFNLKYRLPHPVFEYIQTEVNTVDKVVISFKQKVYFQGASNLIDSQIFGDQCVSDSISLLLAVMSPVLASSKDWDGVILAETNNRDLDRLLEFIYMGR